MTRYVAYTEGKGPRTIAFTDKISVPGSRNLGPHNFALELPGRVVLEGYCIEEEGRLKVNREVYLNGKRIPQESRVEYIPFSALKLMNEVAFGPKPKRRSR